MRLTMNVVLLLLTSPSRAASPSLEQADAQFAALEYSAAVATAEAVLARGGNEPADLVRAYTLLGKALAGLGRDANARRYFQRLLALNPGFALDPSVSPKTRRPLVEAQTDWAGRPGLTVAHTPPATGDTARQLVLTVRVIEDPLQMVKAARVAFRLPGKQTVSDIRVAGGKGTLSIPIPLPALAARPGAMRYHIDMLDNSDNVLLRRGSMAAPLRVQLTLAPASRPVPPAVHAGAAWYRRWWVWAIAGVVVGAGATTAAVVVTTRPSQSDVALTWEVRP